MNKIKFGTDGWRAIIAKDFTTENVARVSCAVAQWIKADTTRKPKIVIGHDCRFGGPLFAQIASKIFIHYGIAVVTTQKGFVSTPMVSLAVRECGASLGVVITASHNPAEYNGYKLKGSFGGPLLPNDVEAIERLIPDVCPVDPENTDLKKAHTDGLLIYDDFEQSYLLRVKQAFDIDLIGKSRLRLAYDAMYGAGQNAMRKILPGITFLHCEHNPSFNGQAPEPIEKNLKEISELIRRSGTIDCGLATDGDADRLGLFDSHGKFIDSHHIILLTIHYLVKYKGLSGKVVTGFSGTPRIKRLCEHYGLPHVEVPIGFKYIAGLMADPNEDVLLGGEESGGIALKTHIPERDGIWMGLTIWEFMARTGKSLGELVDEVYAIVGPFAFERDDLHITESLKTDIIRQCSEGAYNLFGKYRVLKRENLDGFKYIFDDDRWLMIRPSGTEPVLRTYAEAPTIEEVRKMLQACKLTIGA